jgi:hypothetical protein
MNNEKSAENMVKLYSYSELNKAAYEMQRKGGNFAASIADAFFHADNSNKAALLNAFGHLFEKYLSQEFN